MIQAPTHEWSAKDAWSLQSNAPLSQPLPSICQSQSGTSLFLSEDAGVSLEGSQRGTFHPGFLSALAANWAKSSDPSSVLTSAASAPRALKLPSGYRSLELLSTELSSRDSRFSLDSAQGRSATALALAIGGTEVYGRGSQGRDFFTRRGGTGHNMLGFAQFNMAYHRQSTRTPSKYTRFLGDILTGQASMPNGRAGSNHAKALSQAVAAGRIKDGKDFRNFMRQRGFGGSNWQGIDDGWSRNPGLADGLVRFLRGES